MLSVPAGKVDLGPALAARLRALLEWRNHGIICEPVATSFVEWIGGVLARALLVPATEVRAVGCVCLLVESFRWMTPPPPAENANVAMLKDLALRAVPAALALAQRALGEGRYERPGALGDRMDPWALLLEFLPCGQERAALADAAEKALRRAPAGCMAPFQVLGAVRLLRGFVELGSIPASRVAPLVLAALTAWPGPPPAEKGAADPLDALDERALGFVLSNFFLPTPRPLGLPEALWLAVEEVGLGLAGEGTRCPPRADAGTNLLVVRGEQLLSRGEDPLAGPIGAALRGLAEWTSPPEGPVAQRARQCLELLERRR